MVAENPGNMSPERYLEQLNVQAERRRDEASARIRERVSEGRVRAQESEAGQVAASLASRGKEMDTAAREYLQYANATMTDTTQQGPLTWGRQWGMGAGKGTRTLPGASSGNPAGLGGSGAGAGFAGRSLMRWAWAGVAVVAALLIPGLGLLLSGWFGTAVLTYLATRFVDELPAMVAGQPESVVALAAAAPDIIYWGQVALTVWAILGPRSESGNDNPAARFARVQNTPTDETSGKANA